MSDFLINKNANYGNEFPLSSFLEPVNFTKMKFIFKKYSKVIKCAFSCNLKTFFSENRWTDESNP